MKQIISGKFETDSGIIKNDYFDRMLREGKEINITLEACNTGVKRSHLQEHNSKGEITRDYPEGSSYQEDLLNLLAQEVINRKRINPNIGEVKIIINAPSGAANGMLGYLSDFGMNDFISPSSRGDGIMSNGKWERVERVIK